MVILDKLFFAKNIRNKLGLVICPLGLSRHHRGGIS
jgi:hypothetical protein